MFAADFPFASTEEAAAFIDNVPLAPTAREAVCFANTEKHLGLARN